MKIKIRFQRRYNVIITLLACGFSVWMMITRFGLPMESVIKFALICIILVGVIIAIAAPIALISRWFSDRRDR